MAQALTSHHADGYVLLDGTVAETDRVAAEGHISGKVRRVDDGSARGDVVYAKP